MVFYNQSNTPRVRGLTTVMFNSASTATGDTITVDSASQVVSVLRTANTTASTVALYGSLDGTFWTQIGSNITTAVLTAQTLPVQYLRVVVSVITNTAKTAASLTQTGGTATFTSNSHGFLAGEYVTVAGANQAGYNGSKLILTADTNTFTFAVDSATVTPATTGTSITANGNLRVLLGE